MAPTVAQISASALTHNLDLLRRRSGERALMAVVKADAYGHGAVRVARHLSGRGVEQFAVATLPEALALREAGQQARILVFGAPMPDELATYGKWDLEAAVVSRASLEAVLSSGVPLRVHLKVDTGMGRLGLTAPDALEALRRLDGASGLELAGIWTHLASADDPGSPFNSVQLERWHEFLHQAGGAPAPVHVSASAGPADNPDVMAHSDVVRVGIALYGLYQAQGAFAPHRQKPAMRLVSRVAHVKDVPAGTPISYGGTWVAPERCRIATVAAGYADGYPRRLSNVASVGIAGVRCPVVGKICMDMLMARLPLDGPEAAPGDEVVLFGEGGPSCHEVACWAGAITYEIVCGVSSRVPRLWMEDR